jgi:hypothetical protein
MGHDKVKQRTLNFNTYILHSVVFTDSNHNAYKQTQHSYT